MNMPTLSTPTEKLLEYGAYHLALLKAEDATLTIADDFQYIQDNLRKSKESMGEKRDKTLSALALKNRNDHLLDKEVMTFEKVLLENLGKDRKDPMYKKLFPAGRFKVTKLPVNRVMEAVIILEKNIESSEIEDSLKSYSESLRLRRQSLHESLNSYRAALRSEGETRVELQLAKEEWIRLYSISHGLVKSIFPSDPGMISCFFPET
ncbi:MAG: hypothetical protein JXR95_03030 [Deltaproteobacteria bacterium]|nr:hypothetical protein [Deltaproteobacteria bacterium]